MVAANAMPLAEGYEWAYLPNLPIEDRKQLAERIVSVWAKSAKRGVLDNLGTGFVVGRAVDSKKRSLPLVVTAAHVLQYAYNLLRPELLNSNMGPFPRPLAKDLGDLTSKNEILILTHSGDSDVSPITHDVRRISVIEDADLAVMVPRPVKDSVIPAFAINSDPLQPGTRVMMVGHSELHAADTKPDWYKKNGILTVERSNLYLDLHIRVGEIVRVHEEMRHKPVFGYETNIPMPPGMSGAPVFVFAEGSHMPLDVVGMCMSDSPTGENINTKESGSSFVVAAQNFFCLPVPCSAILSSWQKTKQGPPPVGNFFVDRGKRGEELSVHLGSGAPFVKRS